MRFRSINNVHLEIIKYKLQGYNEFTILDDNFNIDKNRLLDFCKIAKKEQIIWKTNCSVSSFDLDSLFIMRQSGCLGMSIGIESADYEVQKKTGKIIDLEHAENLVKKASQLGIKVTCGFILFHYCDTQETIQKTIDFSKKMTALGALSRYTINTPFHGTYQYQHRDELQLKIVDNNYDNYTLGNAVIDTSNFNHAYMEDLLLQLNNQIIDTNFLDNFLSKHNITDPKQITPDILQQLLNGALK